MLGTMNWIRLSMPGTGTSWPASSQMSQISLAPLESIIMEKMVREGYFFSFLQLASFTTLPWTFHWGNLTHFVSITIWKRIYFSNGFIFLQKAPTCHHFPKTLPYLHRSLLLDETLLSFGIKPCCIVLQYINKE